MSALVEFIDTSPGMHESLHPKPAKRVVPDWYKRISSYSEGFSNKDFRPGGMNPSTIKKCVPVFDSITSGYILFTPVDLEVVQGDAGKGYGWSDSAVKAIDSHPHEQAENHPYPKDQKDTLGNIPKWRHPWIVKTPKGYSSLFLTPMHREVPFKIMEGVVDTDVYHSPVNLPFVFNDPNLTGLIPAGTPMAQVIPFRREQYTHTVQNIKSMKFDVDRKTENILNSVFFNAYKKFFWTKKDYS